MYVSKVFLYDICHCFGLYNISKVICYYSKPKKPSGALHSLNIHSALSWAVLPHF